MSSDKYRGSNHIGTVLVVCLIFAYFAFSHRSARHVKATPTRVGALKKDFQDDRYEIKISALALFVGWRYLTPPHPNNAVWLIQYTLGSHTTKNNNVLAESLRRLGKYPIVAETMPNWTLRGQRLFNHCENWNAKNMM